MAYRAIKWSHGPLVLAYLNNVWPDEKKPKNAAGSRKRITKLVESLRVTQDLALESASSFGNSIFASREQALKLQRAVLNVNELLKPFVLTPSIPLLDFWQPDEEDPALVKIAFNIDRTRGGWKGVSQKEFEAIQAIFRLVRKGNLERLKQCRCGLWWYADRKDQRGCSDFCKSKDRRDTEEYKRDRRERKAKSRATEPSRKKFANAKN